MSVSKKQKPKLIINIAYKLYIINFKAMYYNTTLVFPIISYEV